MGEGGVKNGAHSALSREEALEGIIKETLWMACRYAHGRNSWAVGAYNAAAKEALSLNVVSLGPETFAIDGSMKPEMSGLTLDEFQWAMHEWSEPNAIRTHIPRREASLPIPFMDDVDPAIREKKDER